jgi:hypothetical protein
MASHNARDNSFKLILGNHELFTAFLRNFVPVDLLHDVRPQDIEDVSGRFLPLFQDNRDSDTVMRINLHGGPEDPPLFVIAIVEHESSVNYRSPFKMLQYITLVLDQWEKDANRDRPGISETRDFRYPPVLPIVFYDGEASWTAERNFSRRTLLNGVFAKYIPSFEYELVDLNTYKEEDILRFNDVLSLILLIDRVRTPEGLSFLKKLPKGYIEKMSLKIPPGMSKLISDVMTVLLDRLEVPGEEIAAVTDRIERKEYQTMFDVLVKNVLEDRRLAREEGLEEGRTEGRSKSQEEFARKALEKGLSPDVVREITGLDGETLKKLAGE